MGNPIGVPRSFYKTAEEWLSSQSYASLNRRFLYTTCYPEHVISCLPPKTIEPNIHWKFVRDAQHISPAAFVAVLPQGRVWGENGVVITADNKLLAEVSIEFNKTPQEHSLFEETGLPPKEYTQDCVAVLASVASWNYYHWMFDILPRLHLLEKSGMVVNRFIVNLTGASFQEETLRLLNVKEKELTPAHKNFHLEARRLIVPSLPGHSGFMPKWTCTYLRNKFLLSDQVKRSLGYERIYISRKRAASRKVINENRVEDILERHGFKSVMLETMSIREQAAIFAYADCIVSPHGAGLTNLVFCRPKTKVIEFFSPDYVNVLYWYLSTQMDLDYYYFLGRGKRPIEGQDPHEVCKSIFVGVDELEATLELAGIK